MQQSATIISIKGEKIECKVDCGDACKGCAARKVCGGEEEKEGKVLTLTSYNKNHKVGDHITIEVSNSMGLKAVILAYLLPVAILIGVLLTLQAVGVEELTAGLSALGALALYFIAMKIFKIGNSVSVSISEDNF